MATTPNPSHTILVIGNQVFKHLSLRESFFVIQTNTFQRNALLDVVFVHFPFTLITIVLVGLLTRYLGERDTGKEIHGTV